MRLFALQHDKGLLPCRVAGEEAHYVRGQERLAYVVMALTPIPGGTLALKRHVVDADKLEELPADRFAALAMDVLGGPNAAAPPAPKPAPKAKAKPAKKEAPK